MPERRLWADSSTAFASTLEAALPLPLPLGLILRLRLLLSAVTPTLERVAFALGDSSPSSWLMRNPTDLPGLLPRSLPLPPTIVGAMGTVG